MWEMMFEFVILVLEDIFVYFELWGVSFIRL